MLTLQRPPMHNPNPLSLASFPGLAQLSITSSTEKWGENLGIFSIMSSLVPAPPSTLQGVWEWDKKNGSICEYVHWLTPQCRYVNLHCLCSGIRLLLSVFTNCAVVCPKRFGLCFFKLFWKVVLCLWEFRLCLQCAWIDWIFNESTTYCVASFPGPCPGSCHLQLA